MAKWWGCGVKRFRATSQPEEVTLTLNVYTADRMLKLLQEDYVREAGIAAVGEMPSTVTDERRRELVAAYGAGVVELEEIRGQIMAREYRREAKRLREQARALRT